MGFFDNLKSRLNTIQRDPDLLEGGAAIVALVAAADGNISEKEEADAKKRATTSKAILATGFNAVEIERMVDKMLDKADGGSRSGRRELYAELDDIAGKDPDGTKGELLILLGLDVADNDGIDPKEEAVLRECAKRLHVDYDRVSAL